jgi:hypothetical protein
VVVRCDKKTGERRATWGGILTCGHVWTCPVCSAHLRSERAERITNAVEYLKGRWQMQTYTIAHHPGMRLQETIAGMMKALRRMKQGGTIQRVWGERVTASVRTLEVTHGDNGWHPHVHLLVRTSEWTPEEREALQRRWQDCVERELGAEARPSKAQAVTWSEPFDGAEEADRSLYVTKLGLEVAGIAKLGKRGNLTSWGVAEKASQGSGPHVWLWREFHAATRGRRMIEMDDRMATAAKLGAEAKALAALEATAADATTRQPCTCGLGDHEGPHEHNCHAYDPKEHPEAIRIQVHRDDLRALRMQENAGRHWILAAVLSAAEERGELGVHAWVQWARERVRPTPRLDLGGRGPRNGARC